MSSDSEDENLTIHDDATEEISETELEIKGSESRQSNPESIGSIVAFQKTVVKIVGSVVRLDRNKSAYTCYLVSILYKDEERWRIEKRYSNFMELDEMFKKEKPTCSKPQEEWPKLPEKKIIDRLSPSVIDNRKKGLEKYLQDLIKITPEWPQLINFLTTDIKLTSEKPKNMVRKKLDLLKMAGQMEGYLSKRGKKLRIWKPRYYVFRGGYLMYYRTGRDKDGKPDGQIRLDDATINSFQAEELKHGMILTVSGQQHILFAENDEDRDEWVRILSAHIDMMTPVDEGASKKIASTRSSPENDSHFRQSFFEFTSPIINSLQTLTATQRTPLTNQEPPIATFKTNSETKKDGKTEVIIVGKNGESSTGFFRKQKKAMNEEKESVFGSNLKNHSTIPSIFVKCIQYIDEKGLKEEGIYRITGPQTEINELREIFEQGVDKDVKLWNYSVHSVTSILKSFIRELPEPIQTESLKLDFYSISNIEDKSKQIRDLSRLLASLPSLNYETLLMIMGHLKRVCDCEQENKMGQKNISILLAPILQIPNSLFCSFISDFDEIKTISSEKREKDIHKLSVISDLIDSDEETNTAIADKQ